jgi:hypothetical protein
MKTDFKVEVARHTVVVRFAHTMSVYTFNRFTNEREIAEFGPVSPAPVELNSLRSGLRSYSAAEVRAMAFRLATAAAISALSGR